MSPKYKIEQWTVTDYLIIMYPSLWQSPLQPSTIYFLGFFPGPLTPRDKHFPATRSCLLPFVYFLCDLSPRASVQNYCQLEEFINLQVLFHLYILSIREAKNKVKAYYSIVRNSARAQDLISFQVSLYRS